MSQREQPPRPSAPAPARVGRYDILAAIASGGMATVYLAQQRGVGGFRREVALKLTHAHLREQPNWASELLEEGKIAARIQHPNVVQLLDVDDDPLGVFLVMQYVEGDTLAGLLRQSVPGDSRMPDSVGLRILDDALAGLHAAHELRDAQGELAGLVHRDFSPQNILVGTDGVARLADFGVAKAADRAGFTRTGTIKGKFGYMSPEQVRDRPLDRRSDVWAAGVVAWELLAGRRLYPSGDQTSTLFRIVTERPPLLRSVRPDIPEALEDAVASALAIDVDRRCPSAEELRRRIGRAWASVSPVAERAEVAAHVRAVRGADLADLRRRVGQRQANQGNPHGAPREAPSGEPRTEASVVSESAETQRRSPPSRVAGRVALALGAIALAAAAIGVRMRYTVRYPEAPEARPSSPADVPPTSASPLSSIDAPATDVPAAEPTVASDLPTDTLTIDANATLAQIRVNGRSIAVGSPAREVLAPIPADIARAGLLVEGIAADGRRVSTTLPPGARKARLVFSDRAPALSRPTRPAPTASAAAPAAPVDSPSAPKLHASPYE